MGASNSKVEEDKALQLCQERKKFVKQALNGRCLLADTHVNYIQSLRVTGTALWKFVEPDAPIGSSLYTSAIPEPIVLIEKSHSQFSFSSPSVSQRMDTTEKFSPPSSPPPTSSRYQANHMKFGSTYWRKVEEKPSVPIIGSVTSSSTPQTTTPRSIDRPETSPFETPPIPPVTPPWDFFGPPGPIDSQFSSQEMFGLNHSFRHADEIRQVREEEGIPELEDESEKDSFSKRGESQESEDEFDDDPPTDTLIRSFENVNRVLDPVAASGSPANGPTENLASEAEVGNGEKGTSPALSPLRAASTGVAVPNHIKTTPVKEEGVDGTVARKDFFSSMKEIESLFLKASESGREVPMMLEANKFHFRPIFPGKERGSVTSELFKSCFSCGEDPSHVQEEPAQTAVKYLTWHRTTSSRSSSSRNPLGSKDEMEDITSNLFDNFCMVSGSHASTLDRLYAWERKLFDEVKASKRVRKDYDSACKLLRLLESKGESSLKIDKTRAVVKDLHSRIRVAIHRIDTISKKIEELRDKELQPQLEELIEGLGRMWGVMLECHKQQFQIISIAVSNGNTKISFQSESRRQISIHLENELSSLSSSFTKWIGAQKSYVQSINGWLMKCVSLPQTSSKRKRRLQPPPIRNFGPPIYVTCGVWSDMLEAAPTKEVADSIKGLVAEITRFLPRQEKNQGKGGHDEAGVNLLRDEAVEDRIAGFDGFKSSLAAFLGQMNNYAEYSSKMFSELQKKIRDAKSNYEQKSQI